MANGREVNEGRFSLIVQGDGLPVEEIEKALGLQATRLIRKGEVLNRLPRAWRPAVLALYNRLAWMIARKGM